MLNDLSLYQKLIYNTAKFAHNFRADNRLSGFDRGREFESKFYDMLRTLPHIQILSEAGHFDLGMDATTLSGLNHEIDCVVTDGSSIFLFELKHYFSGEVTKDMVLIFNQKVLDFALNYLQYISSVDFHPIFLTQSQTIRDDMRVFCQIWGISMVDRQLFHPLILEQIATELESKQGITLRIEEKKKLDYLVARERRRFSDLLTLWSPGKVTLNIGIDPFETAKEAVTFQKELQASVLKLVKEVKGASINDNT